MRPIHVWDCVNHHRVIRIQAGATGRALRGVHRVAMTATGTNERRGANHRGVFNAERDTAGDTSGNSARIAVMTARTLHRPRRYIHVAQSNTAETLLLTTCPAFSPNRELLLRATG